MFVPIAPTINIAPTGRIAHIPTPIILAPLPIIDPTAYAATVPAQDPGGGAPAPDSTAAPEFNWDAEQERAKRYVEQAKAYDDS